jgi:hypothetical protein
LREDKVAQAEEGVDAGALVDLAKPDGGYEQRTGQAGYQQAGNQGRKNAADAAGVEVAQELPQALPLEAGDGGADDEAGDDEEHVYADETAG